MAPTPVGFEMEEGNTMCQGPPPRLCFQCLAMQLLYMRAAYFLTVQVQKGFTSLTVASAVTTKYRLFYRTVTIPS